MTIYEVLERMIIGPRFRADEEQAAITLIHEMRDMNAFGSMATALDKPTHDCDFGQGYIPGIGIQQRCKICGKGPDQ